MVSLELPGVPGTPSATPFTRYSSVAPASLVAATPECLKQPVTEDLSLPFFIAFQRPRHSTNWVGARQVGARVWVGCSVNGTEKLAARPPVLAHPTGRPTKIYPSPQDRDQDRDGIVCG